MYKRSSCPDCKKEILVSIADMVGSGHDNWDHMNSWRRDPTISIPKNTNKLRTVDSRLEIISSTPFSK